MLFRKPYCIFFSAKKDVQGGNKKIVPTVKSLQDGAGCWKGNARWWQEQALLYGSCHLYQGQKTRGDHHVGAWSAVTLWRVRQHFKPLTFPDGNKEWFSSICKEAKHWTTMEQMTMNNTNICWVIATYTSLPCYSSSALSGIFFHSPVPVSDTLDDPKLPCTYPYYYSFQFEC